MQLKSNVTFKSAPLDVLKTMAVDFRFKFFHYSSHCAHRVVNLCKNAANTDFRGGGTPWLQPKSNVTFKLASPQLFKFLSANFNLNIFIIVATVPIGL